MKYYNLFFTFKFISNSFIKEIIILSYKVFRGTVGSILPTYSTKTLQRWENAVAILSYSLFAVELPKYKL